MARSNKKRAATDTSAAPLVRGMQYRVARRAPSLCCAREPLTLPFCEERLGDPQPDRSFQLRIDATDCMPRFPRHGVGRSRRQSAVSL